MIWISSSTTYPVSVIENQINLLCNQTWDSDSTGAYVRFSVGNTDLTKHWFGACLICLISWFPLQKRSIFTNSPDPDIPMRLQSTNPLLCVNHRLCAWQSFKEKAKASFPKIPDISVLLNSSRHHHPVAKELYITGFSKQLYFSQPLISSVQLSWLQWWIINSARLYF